jgi:HSP20 family protein
VDVRETDNEFLVSAEIPGLTRDDVEVTVENGVLSLTGEKQEEREEGGAESGYRIVERRYGRFQRSFSLPRGVDAEKVEAKFSDGVLKITLPKIAAAKPRQIKIGS